MTTRAQIVDSALEWIGTPYVHQQRVKGKAVDCDNFIAAVAEESGAVENLILPNDYRRHEDGSVMLALLDSYLDFVGVDIDEALPGDVIALHKGFEVDKPRHLAFLTTHDPYPKMVHASERGVRHHRIDAHFKAKVHSVWRIRNLTD